MQEIGLIITGMGIAFGNPFRYTDPSGKLFYIMPSMAMDMNGGLSFGLTAGIGAPGFGAQLSVGYAVNSGSWSVAAGISAGFVSAGLWQVLELIF